MTVSRNPSRDHENGQWSRAQKQDNRKCDGT